MPSVIHTVPKVETQATICDAGGQPDGLCPVRLARSGYIDSFRRLTSIGGEVRLVKFIRVMVMWVETVSRGDAGSTDRGCIVREVIRSERRAIRIAGR